MVQPNGGPTPGPLDRSVIAGGGGKSTGGNFTVEGTVGEVSAGNAQGGGQFVLNGGFWNAFAVGASPTPTPTPTPSPSPSPSPSPTPGSGPRIFLEEGTNNAAVIDSVTFVRGPFRLLNTHNFSADQRTRIILFTSSLGLAQPDPAVLSVQASGVNLPVEAVGPFSAIPGFNASYIVVRLPDNLVPGMYQLTVTLNGLSSNAAIITILP
jgi:hypothetical protein